MDLTEVEAHLEEGTIMEVAVDTMMDLMVDVVVGNSIPDMDTHWGPHREELDAEALVENAVKGVIQGHFLHMVLEEMAVECKALPDTAEG
jgi:hypothetical protein